MTCVRGEVVPPHGEVIRTDARFRAGTVPETAILVKHGFKGFKDWGFFPHLCDRLARAGHLVVSYNGSRNGIGPGLLDFTDLDAFSRNTISHEVDDLHWMADRLLAGEWSGGRRPRAAGLLGHSRGGASSVIVASERDDIASLATWAAISTFHRWSPEQEAEWERNGVIHVQNARTGQDMPLLLDLRDDLKENRDRLDVAAAASRVRAPWLVVHGTDDATVPLDEARLLARCGRTASLEVIRNSGHAFEAEHPLGAVPRGLKAAIAATLRHFAATLTLCTVRHTTKSEHSAPEEP